MTTWTDERVKLLKDRWGTASAGVIAIELGGISRNAVIGKAMRLGLAKGTHSTEQLPCSSRMPRTLRPPRKPRQVVKRFTNYGNRFQTVEVNAPDELPTPRIEDQDIPFAQRRTLLELRSQDCRWPVGDPGTPEFFFCGGQAKEGYPYCAHHCRVAYQPLNPTSRPYIPMRTTLARNGGRQAA